jgi:sialidase-1
MNKQSSYALLLLLLVTVSACTQKIYKQTGINAITITASAMVNPVLIRNDVNPAVRINVNIPAGNTDKSFLSLQGQLNADLTKDISKLEVYMDGAKSTPESRVLVGSVVPVNKNFSIPMEVNLKPGSHNLWLSVTLKETANMDGLVEIKATQLKDDSGMRYLIAQHQMSSNPIGIALRKPKDDGIASYRIPGIVTTDKGTLISVYDIRFDNSRDLPGNIDVGMNRSTDGGKTWSAMKTIMDMGAPHENNGVGDPAILFDPVTKTIWVTALWSKGNRSIAGSGPGLSPDETGQFAITSSTDDGLTWTKPYSITTQVKNPEWRLFFPGPGNGIAMADGKIVFAAQYWDANKMPHSTLIYSADHGKSWKSGIGAKSNTTESQLVETTPGTLMLNMRDNRGKFRSVATTTDMGQTWTTHPTSFNTLTDPVCMASLIKVKVNVKGKLKEVLFFSNVNVPKGPRKDITIKASLDLGETWLPANELLLDEREGFGYSALTKIDDNTIGILYEGISLLHFVRIPVNKIIK